MIAEIALSTRKRRSNDSYPRSRLPGLHYKEDAMHLCLDPDPLQV